MVDREQTIDLLENLIETCRDGEQGFREAAENIKDPQLKSYCNQISAERGRFARELRSLVQGFGENEPQQRGSVAGALHRAWIDLKEKLGGGDHSILEAVEQGEDSAQKAYQDALKHELPSDVLGTVRQQAQSVFAVHDRIKLLRDMRKAA